MVRVPGLKQMSCHDAAILDRLPFQTPLLLGLARDVDCTPWLGPCLAFGWQSRFWASTDDQEQLEIWQCSFFALVCQRVHEMLLSFVEYRPTLENGASEAVMDLLLAEMCDALHQFDVDLGFIICLLWLFSFCVHLLLLMLWPHQHKKLLKLLLLLQE
tara:strand:- start:1679 stop:2152 length:474 start_codon:yes stop_codon:yes gene_type:complete